MRKISTDPNPEYILKSGLCATCKNASTCMYLRGASKPILHCEEFEPFPPRPGTNPAEAKMSKLTSKPENTPQAKPKHLGLCANCKHRETCKFPKPTGGVWHCEEYE